MDSKNPYEAPLPLKDKDSDQEINGFQGENQNSLEFYQMFLILYLPFLILGVAVVIVVFFL